MSSRLSDMRLTLRLPFINELDDGALDIISGTATLATFKQNVTFDFRIFLLFDPTFLDIDDALPVISHHLAAE